MRTFLFTWKASSLLSSGGSLPDFILRKLKPCSCLSLTFLYRVLTQIIQLDVAVNLANSEWLI